MLAFVMFIVGLAVGAAAFRALPLLKERIPALKRALPDSLLLDQVFTAPPETPLRAKIEAAIADIEAQIRNRTDVERNLVRLAQLREVLAGDA